MGTAKSKIEIALSRIEAEKKAREEAKRREREQQDKLLVELGRVLYEAASKSDSAWAGYRDRTVAELLTAVGLEMVGNTFSDAPRGEPEPADVDPTAGELGQSVDWPG